MLNYLYCKSLKLPLLGSFIKILNAYAYKGNGSYTKRLAPLDLWKIRVFPAWINSLVISLIISFIVIYFDVKDYDPGSYITGSVPDLLGFAIGVFALIFVLPNGLKEFILKKGGDKFPIEEIPADIAYPLMGLMFTLIGCSLLELIDDGHYISIYLETTLLFFSFEMIIEMIMFIYLLNRVNISSVIELKPKERFVDRQRNKQLKK
jgi:hypothetical protein